MDEFMNSYEEMHSVWYGFSDSLSWARHPVEVTPGECMAEPHYYRMGWFAGKIMQAVLYAAIGALAVKVMYVC